MRLANPRLVIARAAAIAVAVAGCWSLAACAKTPAAAHPAEAAPAAKAGDKDSQTPPPGVDISKLDELGKKIFFRIGNSESSVCGDAQSLINSVKTCRRSVAALRYVAKLIEGG